MKTSLATAAGALLIIAGATGAHGVQPDDPQRVFFENLSTLCGGAYEGRLTVYDADMDAGWLNERLVMHVRECVDDEVRIPLHVGDDRSRTWVLTRTDNGIRLKHDHRHEDGSEDTLTWYGGHTADPGRGWRQSFPVDAYSRGLFLTAGAQVSITNIWNVEVRPGATFAYELVREGRHLRAEFDLTRRVAPPPPPWGHD